MGLGSTLFLAVDHIFNDGKKQREELGHNPSIFYRWLRNHGYPKDRYRLLCHNCNCGIGMFGDNLDRLRAAVKFLEEAGATGQLPLFAA